MVLSGTVRGSDPRARLVSCDVYIAAGGRIERELFDNDDSESWVDVALLESLAAAKMGEHAKALAAEQGLAWVKPTLDPYASHDLVEGLVRLPAEPAPLTEKEVARLDELDASYDEHAAILGDEDSAEEAVAAAEAGMILLLSRDCTPVLQPVFYGERQAEPAEADGGIEVVPGYEGAGKRRMAFSMRLVDEPAMELGSRGVGRIRNGRQQC